MFGRRGRPERMLAVPDATRDRALALLARRKKINAIKAVREDTGLGLKDAKEYVEALEDGRIMPGGQPGPGLYGPGTVFKGAPGASLPVDGPPATAPLSHRVRAFRDQGDMDSAIALVRAETGMARAEAERFVAALD